MLKILFNIIKNNKGAVIALALLTFVSAATSLITPYLSGTFIDILSGQEGTLSVEKCISGIIISGGVGIAVGYFYQLIISSCETNSDVVNNIPSVISMFSIVPSMRGMRY